MKEEERGREREKVLHLLSVSLKATKPLNYYAKYTWAFIEWPERARGKVRSGWMFLFKFHFRTCITYSCAKLALVSLLKIFVVSSESSECAPGKVLGATSFHKILNRINVKSREFTLQIWDTALLCIYNQCVAIVWFISALPERNTNCYLNGNKIFLGHFICELFSIDEHFISFKLH